MPAFDSVVFIFALLAFLFSALLSALTVLTAMFDFFERQALSRRLPKLLRKVSIEFLMLVILATWTSGFLGLTYLDDASSSQVWMRDWISSDVLLWLVALPPAILALILSVVFLILIVRGLFLFLKFGILHPRKLFDEILYFLWDLLDLARLLPAFFVVLTLCIGLTVGLFWVGEALLFDWPKSFDWLTAIELPTWRFYLMNVFAFVVALVAIPVLFVASLSIMAILLRLVVHWRLALKDPNALLLNLTSEWSGERPISAKAWRGITKKSLVAFVDAARGVKNSFPGGNGNRSVIRSSTSHSIKVALSRQEYIRRSLRGSLADASEFQDLEVPPVLVGQFAPRRISYPNAIARQVVLTYQSGTVQSQLFGRASDAMTCFLQTLGDEARSISLEMQIRERSWWEKHEDEYPWTIVIRTNAMDTVQEFISSTKDWFGVGIEIEKYKTHVPQSFHCVAKDGEEGTIAGGFGPPGNCPAYSLTCAHVIGEGCPVDLVAQRHGSHGPDIALLTSDGCYSIQLNEYLRIPPASQRKLADHLRWMSKVYRRGGSKERPAGYIKSLHGYQNINGKVMDFPSVVIHTYRSRACWGLLPRPFFRTRFSRPGDSGSWIVTGENDDGNIFWVGMVISGGEGDNKMESIALLGGAIRLFLKKLLPGDTVSTCYLKKGI